MKKLNQRGQTSFFLVFILVAVFLTFLFAFGIPFAQSFNAALYEAGEDILDDSEANFVNDINNPEIREAILANYDAQRNSIPDQIDVLSVFYQYGWIIVILSVLFIVFMASRRQIERGGIS